MEEQTKQRASVQRRLIELLQRDLPAGWSLRADGDGIVFRHGEDARRLSLEPLYAEVQTHPEQRRPLLHGYAARVLAMLQSKGATRSLTGHESNVFPVIRHHSFVTERADKGLVSTPHTTETAVFYALDQPVGYLLINAAMVDEAGWTVEQLHTRALDNLEQQQYPVRSQQVGQTLVHFISPRDGYAASRILLPGLLERFDREKQGTRLGVAIPHQDVLILADIRDEPGAQLLSRLTYDFASKGDVPISPIPFFYEHGELEPYIVIAKGAKTPD